MAMNNITPEIITTLRAGISPAEQMNILLQQEYDGWAPLHFALHNRDVTPEIITALLDGITPADRMILLSQRTKYGCTPLHVVLALSNRHATPEIITVLLAGIIHADTMTLVLQQDSDSRTPLHLLASKLSPKPAFPLSPTQCENHKTILVKLLSWSYPDSLKIRDYYGKTSREYCPKIFDDCVKKANKLIMQRANAPIAKAITDVDVYTTLPISVAHIIAEYCTVASDLHPEVACAIPVDETDDDTKEVQTTHVVIADDNNDVLEFNECGTIIKRKIPRVARRYVSVPTLCFVCHDILDPFYKPIITCNQCFTRVHRSCISERPTQETEIFLSKMQRRHTRCHH
jgi:hypothetical protein